MNESVVSASTAITHALRGYLSIGDIAFECSGQAFTDLGWVLLEVNDSNQNDVRGIINTYNDSATYTLVRLARSGKSCRLRGLFGDGKASEYQCTLDNVVIENMLVQDTTATVAFRAMARRE